MADLKALLADPSHSDWKQPFPAWVTSFRPSQRDAVAAIVDAYESGATKVVLSAPTGAGKTLIAEMVRRLLGVPATYICVDKGLQSQVVEDFAYAKVLKGRVNYSTLDGPEDSTADDCRGIPDCTYCCPFSACPYRVAKKEAAEADLAVLNTAYLLAEANTGENATFSDRDFVVADEADRLESALMSHVGVQVGRARMQEWGIEPLANGAPADEAEEWVRDRALPALDDSVRRRLAADPGATKLRTQRELRGLRKLRDDLHRVLDALPRGEWVTCQARGPVVEFKPVRVADCAGALLWAHADQWLLMSATVLSAEKMLADLGVRDPWSWVEVDAPSSFPVENRPVYVTGAVQVTHKNPGAARDLATHLRAILDRHPHDRVLVHTVSFRLMSELKDAMDSWPQRYWDRFVFYEPGTRALVLDEYLEHEASVLFAPAMERGMDFKDDACRAVVVCKVPYPDLSDAQVAARLKSGDQSWYAQAALRSLIQSCGRGVRCFDQDTELLTTAGWKKSADIRVGDAVYGIPTRSFSQERPTREGSPRLVSHRVLAVTHNEPEPVLRLKAQSLDLRVTPDHTLIVQRKMQRHYEVSTRRGGHVYTTSTSYSRRAAPLVKVRARDLPSRFKMLLAGRVERRGGLRPRISSDWLWFMGLVIADGHFSKTKSTVTVVQSKPRVVRKIDAVLDRLGLKSGRYVEPLAGTQGPGSSTRRFDKVCWQFSGHDAARVRDLFETGRRRRYSKHRSYAHRTHRGVDGWKTPKKTIPRWFLQRGTVAQFRTLLSGLMDGDGTPSGSGRGGCVYVGVDQDLADRLQELLVLSGFRSRLRLRGRCWEVGFTRNGGVDCVTTPYEDGLSPTWCVNTELGSVVARRAGSTFIAGNSERDWCPTYVLDAQADRLLAQCRKYVPKWWSDAVVRGWPE